MSFEEACRLVEADFEKDWQAAGELGRMERLEREKRAIMGYEEDVAWYKERIGQIISEENIGETEVPPWYLNLKEGIFNELYGLAGLAPWAYDESEKYRLSSSAKLIGNRLYCLIDGVSELQPQNIGARRREQLKRALLLATPRERLEKGFHEVYLRNGIRITIYSGERTKEGQDIMVFRKYILRELSFEEMARLGTIPGDSIPLFELMVKLGFNVLFTGPVRSGKTSFMQVWQKNEDPSLEGLAISTDPETPWHSIMPEAPLMQLVADGEQLETITRSLLRGDNDYIILEEMRDAQAYNIALEITETGTRRCKATIHSDDPVNLPFKIASKVCTCYGGDLQGIILQVFRNFNYVFEFCTLQNDRAQKRLKAIWLYGFDEEKDRPFALQVCRYDKEKNNWSWQAAYPAGRITETMQSSELMKMEEIMKELEKRYPMAECSAVYPRYYRPENYENPKRHG